MGGAAIAKDACKGAISYWIRVRVIVVNKASPAIFLQSIVEEKASLAIFFQVIVAKEASTVI